MYDRILVSQYIVDNQASFREANMSNIKYKNHIIDNAHLMAEWDWNENEKRGLDPGKLTPGSGKKAWWICKEGHEWQAEISSRNKGAGCPECYRQRRLKVKDK